MDQAHEQVNACVNGDGGAVGLTDDPNALRCWMIAGSDVARAIGEFQEAMEPVHRDNTEEPLESKHHKENESWQKLFVKDVRSLTSSIEELGNLFEEDSKELLTLYTKQIADISVRSAYKTGKDQFDLFVKERRMERKVSVDDLLSRNKLALSTTKHLSKKKGKQQFMLMKSDMQLFSRVYIRFGILMNSSDMRTSLALHLFQIWEIFDWVGKVIFCHVWRIYQQQNLKHQLLRTLHSMVLP